MFDGFSKKYLFSYHFRKVGLVLFLSGVIALYIRFGLGIKPGVLEMKVFAVYSSIFDSKYFTFVGNNIGEEIVMLLLLSGLFFIAFSREKIENDQLWIYRLKSFILATYVNIIFLALSILFIFGWGFMGVLSINLVSFLLIYSIFFRSYMYFNKNSLKK